MPSTSTVSSSLLKRRGRWDTGYYRPEYLHIENIIRGFRQYMTLGQLTIPLFAKGIFDINASEYVDGGIPFIRITNLRRGLLDTEDLAYISPERSAADGRTELSQYDLVLSKTAYPAASLVQLPRCNVSQDCIAVKTNQGPQFNCYLAMFLNTQYGLAQMERLFQGNVQAHLGLNETRRVLIPIPTPDFISMIAELVADAIRKREEFYGLYREALNRLSGILDLARLKQQPRHLTWTSQFREISAARRWDSTHFRPSLKTLNNLLREKAEVRLLRDIVTVNQRGRQPVYVPEGSISVVNSQHIGPQQLRYDALEQTSQAFYDNDLRSRLYKNDVVVYTTGAYVGRTNIFLEDDPAVASNHVNILRIKSEYDPAYIALVLNSAVGAMQTEKQGTGSTQVELYPNNLSKFLIPILDQNVQKEIGDKVRASYSSLKESKALLERAITNVEDLVGREAVE